MQGSLLMNRLPNSGNEVAVEEIFGEKKIPTTRVKTMYYRTKYKEVCTIAAGYVVKRIRTVSSKPILASPSPISEHAVHRHEGRYIEPFSVFVISLSWR